MLWNIKGTFKTTRTTQMVCHCLTGIVTASLAGQSRNLNTYQLNKFMLSSKTKQKAWQLYGKDVCTVTHPNKPNFDGYSRGRKIHLTSDRKTSICNMIV